METICPMGFEITFSIQEPCFCDYILNIGINGKLLPLSYLLFASNLNRLNVSCLIFLEWCLIYSYLEYCSMGQR
jgi:hypothetical protein